MTSYSIRGIPAPYETKSLSRPDSVQWSLQQRAHVPATQAVTDFRSTGLNILLDDDPLWDLYMSRANVQIVQNGIRAEVHHLSQKRYTIREQPDGVVREMMQSAYMEHMAAARQHATVTAGIELLNHHVIQMGAKAMMSELKSYYHYLRVVGQPTTTIMSAPTQTRYMADRRGLENPNRLYTPPSLPDNQKVDLTY